MQQLILALSVVNMSWEAKDLSLFARSCCRLQESAIKFLSYESAKRVFAQYWDEVPDQTMISNSSRFVAGGIGGVTSQFGECPGREL